MTFGEKIRRLRETEGINQTELGKAVQMTQRKISYIECDRCEPSIADIVAFCCHFAISADDLLDVPKALVKRKTE